ncbi:MULTISPECIES: hypothetical protein [Paenibacillus]|uniref:DUF7669 domain-containing protein n=1 Tax=Paenibacillus TaxID=44249 RepID=UPI00096E88FA|nr:hypothetical protein [Paenibacillus odorifer]OMD87526.1 hypothetical protein BSK53_00535 [Paenibacillus odorifer]
MAYKTCRGEILISARMIVKSKGINELTIKEMVEFMKENNTVYNESTIGSHIRSRCCINGKRHHATVYNDFRKLDNGKYELINFN